jgi:hypothetical protein
MAHSAGDVIRGNGFGPHAFSLLQQELIGLRARLDRQSVTLARLNRFSNRLISLPAGREALATFAYEIDNDAPANEAADLTAVTGNLTIDLGNTAILTLGELGSSSWTIGEKLTLISYSGTWNGGLFNYGGTLADDSTINFSGMGWSFNYNDTVAGTNYTGDLTGSRYVTMTAIPEPSVTTLLGGLGILALLRRRRK